MNLRRTIPSFIHFGSESFHVRYTGQPETCHRCDECGHNASSCKRSRCFNCGKMDHTINACPLNKICAICGSARHAISECVEWIPHEEDFDNFGMDYQTPATEDEAEGGDDGELGADDDEPDDDDGNEADDDADDEDKSGTEKEDETLATNTVEEPTPSTLSTPTPPNPFANIAFNQPIPKPSFSITSSPTLFTDSQPDSLEELFSKRPPKIDLNPSATSPTTSPSVQATIQPSEPPKPQKPPKNHPENPTFHQSQLARNHHSRRLFNPMHAALPSVLLKSHQSLQRLEASSNTKTGRKAQAVHSRRSQSPS